MINQNEKSTLELFAERLAKMIKDTGIGKQELALKVGVDPGSVTKWLQAENGGSRANIEAMAEIFNINPAWLMGYEAPKQIIEKIDGKSIPIVGNVAAGIPIDAIENVTDFEYISGNLDVDYCLKIKGDSMHDTGIYNGSLVYVKKQNTFTNGQVVIALIGTEATCKRAYKENGDLTLRSDNPLFPPQVYKKKDADIIRIQGIVKYVRNEVK